METGKTEKTHSGEIGRPAPLRALPFLVIYSQRSVDACITHNVFIAHTALLYSACLPVREIMPVTVFLSGVRPPSSIPAPDGLVSSSSLLQTCLPSLEP